MSSTSQSVLRLREQTALAGIDKRLAGVSSLTLGGVSYTPADLKKILSDDLAASANTGTQRAAVRAAVKAEQLTRAKARLVLKLLRAYIVLEYGNDVAAVLQDFGFPPPRETKRTVKAKAQAVDKSAATRKARHTMGPKQKKQVTGTTQPDNGGAAPAPAMTASK